MHMYMYSTQAVARVLYYSWAHSKQFMIISKQFLSLVILNVVYWILLVSIC